MNFLFLNANGLTHATMSLEKWWPSVMGLPLRIRRLTIAMFLTFIGSAVFVAGRMITAPTSIATAAHIRVKSDYVLMLLQCLLGALAMMLPGFLQRKIQLNIPSRMIIVYAVFLYCAIYLGEVHSFYYLVPQWDSILHASSGMALCAIGFHGYPNRT